MKLLTVSDLGVATGFARVMGSLIEEFPEDWDIHSLAINYFGDPHEINAKLYPASVGGDLYGIRRIGNLVDKIEPDSILILQDAWIIQKYLDILSEEMIAKTILYIPIDAGPYQIEWLEKFDQVKRVCVYTEFGKAVLLECMPELDNIEIINHGIDTSKFHPIDQDGCREALNIDKDFFVVLNVNRNQPRKRIDIAAKAFGLFAQRHEDVRYHHHAGVEDSGWNITVLAKRYGWSKKLIITSRDLSPQKYVSDEVLNLMYNSADVGLNTSMGEGWGLCFTEDADILTEFGYKSIRDITMGDWVFDRQGQLTKVTGVSRRDYDGSLNKVKVAGLSKEILVTPEHPFYTQEFGWMEAQDLTDTTYLFKPEISFKSDVIYTDLTDYADFVHDNRYVYLNRLRNDIGEKIPTKDIQAIRKLYNRYVSKNMVKKVGRGLPIDTSLALILSFVLANIPPSKKRFFYDAKVETSLFKLLNYKRPANTKNLYPGKTLIKAFTNMAFDQRIYMAMSLETLRVFFYDLLDRVGYSHPSNKRLLLGAKSQDKQRILRIVLQRLGIAWSEFTIKDGTNYFSLDKRYLKSTSDKPHSERHRTEDIDGYYFKVLSNTVEHYTGEVYNLETEDHTYTVFGYVVHNCNMEHATVSKPQIIPANSANLELYVEDRGILVPISHYDTGTVILTEGAVVSPTMVAKAMDYAYNCRDEIKEIGKKSMEYFLQEKFTWSNVASRFKKVIEDEHIVSE